MLSWVDIISIIVIVLITLIVVLLFLFPGTTPPPPLGLDPGVKITYDNSEIVPGPCTSLGCATTGLCLVSVPKTTDPGHWVITPVNDGSGAVHLANNSVSSNSNVYIGYCPEQPWIIPYMWVYPAPLHFT